MINLELKVANSSKSTDMSVKKSHAGNKQPGRLRAKTVAGPLIVARKRAKASKVEKTLYILKTLNSQVLTIVDDDSAIVLRLWILRDLHWTSYFYIEVSRRS